MNLEIARAGLSLLENGEDFAWVTLLETRGSSPRHDGATMLVRADGSIVGSIGGGPLEARAIEQARQAIKSGRVFVEGFDAAQLGMTCGGGGSMLIERVSPRQMWAQDLFRALVKLLEEGRRGWLVTVEPTTNGADYSGGSGVPLHRCLVDSTGATIGDLVCDSEALQQLLTKGEGPDRPDHMLERDALKIHVQPVGARGTAYLFGAGHCAMKLTPILSTVGFFTVVIDDRPEFANRERLPTADRIVVPRSFDDVVGTLPINEDSYLVIVTRGHSHDTSVLAQALRTNAYYIGMIGSKKKVARAFRDLTEQGFLAEDLARVHAPIGLPIGAETPEEIAVSIAAQMIQVRSAKGSGK